MRGMSLLIIEEDDREDFNRLVDFILYTHDVVSVVNIQRNVFYVGVERYEDPTKPVKTCIDRELRTSYMAGILVNPASKGVLGWLCGSAKRRRHG